MKYDFDIITDRRGTDCIKYDFARERGKPEGLLPLWVADMDFPCPSEVLDELQKIINHGIFGYTEPKDGYYKAVADWFASRFNFHITKKDIVKAPGVVFAMAQAVRAFTEEGESVMIQTPVYYPFYDIVQNNGRKLVTNKLVYDNGKYFIDFEDFENKIVSRNVKLFLLCSPHNPACRVWTKEELERMNGICKKHDVIILSDEIHCDFVWPGYKHTCFGAINEDAVITTSPTKTFNLAGLQISNIILKNEKLRGKLMTEIKKSGYSQMNTLGLAACRLCYAKGGPWLDALKEYIWENIRVLREFIREKLPKIGFIEPEGTYLAWLDFKKYALTQEELNRRITEGAKLWLNDGAMFGEKGAAQNEGTGFQRINLACPRSILLDALSRLEKEFRS
jgi:cystathionine beta-lyase